jgi:tol-pal system protein YbgF
MRAIGLVLVLIFGLGACATQEDVLTLDSRLAAIERKGLQLEKRNRELAQSNVALEQKRAKLQEDIQRFSKIVEKEDHALRGQYASMIATLDQQATETQQLRGRTEENEHMLTRHIATAETAQQQVEMRLTAIAEQLDAITKRLADVEHYLNMERAAAKAAAARPAKTEPSPSAAPPDDQALYLSAKQAFDKGDFDGARQKFEDVLKRYPNSENADNAQFWLGEIYYREKWYEKAILEYQKVIEKYPQGNKVPSSLLKQGFAFLNIGDKANARLILRELVKKYPDTNEGKIAGQKLEELE